VPEQHHIEIAKQQIDGIKANCPQGMQDIVDSFYCATLASWIEEAARANRNAEFYKDLLDQCVDALPECLKLEAYLSDDGSIQDSPLRLKVPDLVRKIPAAITAVHLKPSVN
jgi:hypothetical protein